MKLFKGLVLGLCALSAVAFAQDSKVMFACVVPAGEILQTEQMSNLIIQNGTGAQATLFEVIGNDALFDDKAAEDKKIGLAFDQVTPEMVDDANQILTDYVLGTDYAEVLTLAGVADPMSIATVYTFTAQDSKNKDYGLMTYVFLAADGKILGSAVILFINENGKWSSVGASCKV